MEFVMPEMNVFNIIFLLLGLYIAAQGVIQMCTKKVIGKGYEQYTKESVQKAARPVGALYAVAGIALLSSSFIVISGEGNENLYRWISSGVAVVAIIALIIVSSKIFKPKNGTKKKK